MLQHDEPKPAIDDRVPSVDLESTPAQIINFIDTWAEARKDASWGSAKEQEAQHLWDFFTAMRGPDQTGYVEGADGGYLGDNVKGKTTASLRVPLRHLAAGKATVAFSYAPKTEKYLTDAERKCVGGHFLNHVRAGVAAVREMFNV